MIIEKLEYEYVFKDTKDLEEQIKIDIIELYGSQLNYRYDIYETDDKIIVELHKI